MSVVSNLPSATLGPIDNQHRVGSPEHPLDAFGGDFIKSSAQYKRPEFANSENDHVIVKLRSAHKTMHEGFIAVREALKTPNPQMTREAHIMAIRKKADNYLSAAGARWDESLKVAQASLAEVDGAIQGKIGPASTMSKEIRAYVRSLKDGDRNAAAQRAAVEGDTLTLAALLEGPAYLSGLTDEQRKIAQTTFLKTHAPELVERKAAIKMALHINSMAQIEAMEGVEKFFDAQTVTRINNHTSKAQAAIDAIDKAIA